MISSQTSRGFTGHEELDAVGLVHMNGRVYDPLVGRMISADPTVPDPMNAQAWNRYSYVGNDPLAFTDPSGFIWFSSSFRSVSNFIRNDPIVRATVQIVTTVILTAALGPRCGRCRLWQTGEAADGFLPQCFFWSARKRIPQRNMCITPDVIASSDIHPR